MEHLITLLRIKSRYTYSYLNKTQKQEPIQLQHRLSLQQPFPASGLLNSKFSFQTSQPGVNVASHFPKLTRIKDGQALL